MKQYIHNPAVFGTPGRRIVEALQDIGTPILDSLVRESIQNSLDASDNASSSQYVKVEYDISDFDVEKLTNHLDGLSSLNNRKDLSKKYLSIRDRNTVGLTGDFFDESSNLKKLVFGFMNNQQKEGSGGSCGIGKTLYYRIGVGLVIYYSRVRISFNKYESLLSAVLIEDSDSPCAIIPNNNGSNKFGISIWGDEVFGNTDGVVKETRDLETINNILSAFNFAPYGDTETGTSIIIPFINERKLLMNNRNCTEEGQFFNSKDYWLDNIEDYLSIAVQRWYAARLNNLDYHELHPSEKALSVSINGNIIDSSRERNFCKLLRTLYKKASLDLSGKEVNDINYNGYPIQLASVELNNIDKKSVGNIAYIKIPCCDLDLEHISLYSYVDQQVPQGSPVVVYCRKPGMIISYESHISDWVPVEKCSEDEYLIGFFVLNSYARLKKADMNIEAYIRDCEQATHNCWKDKQIDSKYNPRPEPHKPPFVKKISEKVAKILSEYIVPNQQQAGVKSRDITFGNLFGKIFLKNVLGKKGRRPSEVENSGSNSSSITASRTHRRTMALEDIRYLDGKVFIKLHLTSSSKNPSSGCRVELHIQSASGSMSVDEWYSKVGTSLPFYINNLELTLKNYDNVRFTDSSIVNLKNLYSSEGEIYGIELSFKDNKPHAFICDIDLELHIRMHESKPSIYITDLE